MSAGDLRGHLRKLDALLRLIKYPRDVDYSSLSTGDPSAFLPILSYTLTSFCPRLTAQLLQAGLELTGKTDLRFIDTVYKVLRDVFQYHPVLSKQQFLQSGFSQRKIGVTCDVINLVLQRQNQLKKPRLRHPSTKSDHGGKAVPSPCGSGSALPDRPVLVNGRRDVSFFPRQPSHSPHTPDGDAQPAGEEEEEEEEDVPLVTLPSISQVTEAAVLEGRLSALEAKVETLLSGLDRLKALEERLEYLENPERRIDHKETEQQMISVSRETWDNLLSRVLILETKLELSGPQRAPSCVSEGKGVNVTTEFPPSCPSSCRPRSCSTSSGSDAHQDELNNRLDKIANMMKATSILVKTAECSQ